MKKLFFDSSTIISLATTCTLHLLEKLHEDFDGDFFITTGVKEETLDKTKDILRFKYEGRRLQYMIDRGIFSIYDDSQDRDLMDELLDIGNNCFYAWKHPIKIIQMGEMSALASAIRAKADAYAVDERTTRLLMQDPDKLKQFLQKRLHENIDVNLDNLRRINDMIKRIPVLRSTELAVLAHEKGYLVDKSKDALEGVLWALKLNGCAISSDEINNYIKKYF